MLEVYHENGFKFFRCHQDKSPNTPGFWPEDDALKKYDQRTGKEKPNHDWKREENQITYEKAVELQKIGEMIGAWIPEDIIVIDLDKHEGKPNGIKTFLEIKEQYGIDFDIKSKTFCVATAGGGYHIFLYAGKNHGFRQGEKAPGIDLKTDAGYVIAAGSPGYRVPEDVIELDIAEIPERIFIWLQSCNSKEPEKKDKTEKKDERKNIPVSLLKKILAKLDVNKFDNNDAWYDLICSAVATAGDSREVYDALEEWSAGDPNYKGIDVYSRISSFNQSGGITPGTFIHILREHGISNYFIKKVLSFNTSIELYENMRDDGVNLPFPEPDYDAISESKEANELFITCGNSVAATLLGFAIQGHILWCDAERTFYLFDGNKWSEFNDMYSIAYTVLIRLTKFMFSKKDRTEANTENFIKLVRTINKTHWKRETINELQCRPGIFNSTVPWDSEKLKETLTTRDGVIDFTNGQVISRKGHPEEFRKSYIPYTCDDILKAGIPEKYNDFLKGLFPDEETLFTVRQASSMYISGNARKVFQVFHGGGDNGKSTFLEIEAEILGDKAYTYPAEMLMTNKYGNDGLPHEAAEFVGKFLLYASEVPKGKTLSLGKVKNLTGDDTLSARQLYQKAITFRPTWQMVLSVNDLPFFDGTDRAFINRLLIIPFEMTFVPDEDVMYELISRGIPESHVALIKDGDELKREIRKEFPAVIKQKINDYLELKHKYRGIIQQSKNCKIHKESYISENNDIEHFIQEMCIISAKSDLYETIEAITEAYKEYSGLYKITSNAVSRMIRKTRQEITVKNKVVTVRNDNPFSGEDGVKKVQKKCLFGIKLKSIEEIEADFIKEEEKEALEKDHHDGIPF